jgi:plasmid stabilization system protein ParE
LEFRIPFTEPALADLRDLMRWSWDNHPETSERLGAAILSRVQRLAVYPCLGVPIVGRKDVHRIVCGSVRIYYRVDEERRTVEVLRLSEAARREPRI